MNKDHLKYVASVLLFGSNGIVASYIPLGSSEIVLLRTGIGSLLLIALFLATGNRFTAFKHPKDCLLVCLSGFAMGSGWLFLFEAYRYIGVSISSLIYYCGPALVMICSPFLFKERLSAATCIGFAAVMLGVGLVNGGELSGGGNLRGIFFSAMSAISLFFLVTFNKKSQHITGIENATVQLFASFALVAAFSLATGRIPHEIPLTSWPWIIAIGAFNTALGCYLYFSPLSNLPVQFVAICGYLEPLSAVVLSSALLGEHMTGVQIIGAALIIGGMLFAELKKTTSEESTRLQSA